MWLYVTDSRAEADRMLAQVLTLLDRPELPELLIDSPEDSAQRVHAYGRAGCERIFVWPPADELRQLERLREALARRRRNRAAGALGEITRLGGGTVESFPEDAEGRKLSGSFLHNGTLALFERHGFERVRKLGKHRWLVTRTIAPASVSLRE